MAQFSLAFPATARAPDREHILLLARSASAIVVYMNKCDQVDDEGFWTGRDGDSRSAEQYEFPGDDTDHPRFRAIGTGERSQDANDPVYA